MRSAPITRGLLGLCALLVWSVSHHGESAILMQVGQNFTGTTLGAGSSAFPPDADGAAGPAHYVELVNGRFSVYNKANGARQQTMTDVSFWARAGVALATGWDVTDPRVLYDSQSQRWFACQVDYDTTGQAVTDHFLIAVSGGPNPMDPWTGFAIPSDPSGITFADFPTLGLDSQGVYLSGEMFDAGDNLIGPALLAIPKTNLLATAASLSGMTAFGVVGGRGDFLQPVFNTDSTVQGAVLASDGLGFDYGTGQPLTNTALIGSTVINAAAPAAAVLASPVRSTVPGFTAPTPPSQPDYTQNLDPGDARLSAVVPGVGGMCYAVQAVHNGVRDAIRWYRLNASDYTLIEAGTICDPNLDLFYPSIAVSTNGTVIVAFNGSSVSNFVSSYAVAGDTLNGVTAFGDLVLLKSGTASYQNIDPTGASRWGDYSATSVDPADPTRFWTIQTITTGPSTWSTQITELRTRPLLLSCAAVSGGLQLSWPLEAAEFDVQTTTNLANANSWLPLAQGRSTNGSGISITVPAVGDWQYFRLSRHP